MIFYDVIRACLNSCSCTAHCPCLSVLSSVFVGVPCTPQPVHEDSTRSCSSALVLNCVVILHCFIHWLPPPLFCTVAQFLSSASSRSSSSHSWTCLPAAAFCLSPAVAMNDAEPMVMMAKQAGKAGYKVAREELLANGAPPFLACELCREYVGLNPCDRRNSTSFQKKAFPGVDWSCIALEEDTLFPKDSHESMEQLGARVADFMEWLMQRPEHEVAVVSHSK
ncbi:hypothetical protein DUNSADRAFT_16118 [Dunaliella salina]|uniref:Uncharacterized protein n=1 Tax=Dunaliella salina TaxID=3046 RepID=A0ABQ7H171_DUNSA|nr:hypothetical protein DUNSADRAFT_16118 [Dunaliella salina]|eukprot:KAF5840603.1 hypothetical protein DUNSADRAFT_16118 [Dunaliella salina]